MQGYIPQYILQRGDSAREYRRRSSTISRTSNSSVNPSPMMFRDTSYDGCALSPTVLSPHESSGSAHHPVHRISGDTSAPIYGNNSLATYRMDAPSSATFPSQDIEDKGNSDERLLSQTTTVDSSNGPGTAMAGDDAEPQNGRFGLARPRLVHFE
ncbi:hypothetical protein IW140_000280 [Coemansia sp. RSA 1813]|nr:hypothetical protein LPJ74_000292 [Coemansia sp. RSA 1843]KAJ2217924.1 hypothetical protein EV179_000068 [Coemansia sp. RSA 487]KAJ2573236.1 hypothetical protein IW140_000280 [Coemansia sp. RSA 1813]